MDIKLHNIHKRFGSNEVLCGVDFQLQAGEIHALMGENGAGKSTLMNVLTGMHQADQGQILIDGVPTNYSSAQAAENNGITFIHQELNIWPNLSILDNLFVGKEPCNCLGFLQQSKMRQLALAKCSEIGIELPLDKLAGECSVGQQQMAEIVKALMTNAQVIIMDEPTAALTERESAKLFMVMRELKSRKVAVVYISHRMEEIFANCDRVTVMRDGVTVSTRLIGETNFNLLVREMVGRELNDRFPLRSAKLGSEVLRLDKLSQAGKFEDISFKVHQGEILGIAGLMGAGRSEIMRTISGLEPASSGQIYLHNQALKIKTPLQAIQNGIGFITENRRDEGLVLDFSISDNISLASTAHLSKYGIINSQRESEFVADLAQRLAVKMSSAQLAVKQLSGGNQQKVVIAKWVGIKPQLLIMDEPTRGVDVGAKREIYQLMNDLTSQGVAIIMVSSELPEVLGMSDRVVVIHEGKVAGELDRANANQEKIMALATGGE